MLNIILQELLLITNYELRALKEIKYSACSIKDAWALSLLVLKVALCSAKTG